MTRRLRARWLPAALVLAAIAACAPKASTRPADASPAEAGAGTCDAAAAARFAGRAADSATIAAARAAAGAARVRALRPGEAATMDYRADRLDLRIDAAGTIRTLRCG